jgi:hypothetical protein
MTQGYVLRRRDESRKSNIVDSSNRVEAVFHRCLDGHSERLLYFIPRTRLTTHAPCILLTCPGTRGAGLAFPRLSIS